MSIKVEGHLVGHIIGANGRVTTTILDEGSGKKKGQFNGAQRAEVIEKATKWCKTNKLTVEKADSVRLSPSKATQEKELEAKRKALEEAAQLSPDELVAGKTPKNSGELAKVAAEQEKLAAQAKAEAAAAKAKEDAETKAQAKAEAEAAK